MKLTGVELRRIRMPLVAPFRTSFGTETERDVLLVRVVTDDAEGWGECVAMSDPLYSSEYVDARRPTCCGASSSRPWRRTRAWTRTRSASALAPFKGHRMAKAALEMAVLDAELRAAGPVVGARARRRPRPCRLRRVGRHHGLDPRAARRGRRLPGRGLRPDQAEDRARLGRRAGAGRPGALRRRRAAAGRRQHRVHAGRRPPPRPARPVRPAADRAAAGRGRRARPRRAGQAHHARRSASTSRSRRPGRPRRPSRLGRVPDRQHQAGPRRRLPRGAAHPRRVRAHGVPVWCGGMLETGIGRAANVALAALPGFTLPGDTSASDRYYRTDITEPFVLEDGHLPVPTGPGPRRRADPRDPRRT